jgi:predicted MFS family arabinose efflux permease
VVWRYRRRTQPGLGVTAVASSVGVDTLAQQRVPEPFRGRVFGTLQAMVWACSLLGAAVGGLAAERFGVVLTLDLAASLVLLAGVVVLMAVPSDARAEELDRVR